MSGRVIRGLDTTCNQEGRRSVRESRVSDVGAIPATPQSHSAAKDHRLHGWQMVESSVELDSQGVPGARAASEALD